MGHWPTTSSRVNEKWNAKISVRVLRCIYCDFGGDGRISGVPRYDKFHSFCWMFSLQLCCALFVAGVVDPARIRVDGCPICSGPNGKQDSSNDAEVPPRLVYVQMGIMRVQEHLLLAFREGIAKTYACNPA